MRSRPARTPRSNCESTPRGPQPREGKPESSCAGAERSRQGLVRERRACEVAGGREGDRLPGLVRDRENPRHGAHRYDRTAGASLPRRIEGRIEPTRQAPASRGACGTIAAGAPRRHRAERGMPIKGQTFFSHGFASTSSIALSSSPLEAEASCSGTPIATSTCFERHPTNATSSATRQATCIGSRSGSARRTTRFVGGFSRSWSSSEFCYVLGRPRGREVELGCAFGSLQTLATAILVLSCTRGVFILGLLPLLFAVALSRAPPAWRRTLVVSAAFALALEVAYVLVRFPNPKTWAVDRARAAAGGGARGREGRGVSTLARWDVTTANRDQGRTPTCVSTYRRMRASDSASLGLPVSRVGRLPSPT